MKKENNRQLDSESNPSESRVKRFFKEAMGFAVAFFIAIGIRSFICEPYNIPSGSMIPSLLVGDYLFISKPTYGYSRYSFPFWLPLITKGRVMADTPKQGDVVVFRMTPDIQPEIKVPYDYIKRVIGLPGDTIQMKNGILHINNQPVPRKYIREEKQMTEQGEQTYTVYQETLPNGVTHLIQEISDDMMADNTDPFVVPAGHFFAMGDNRDNSLDSRFFGAVPFEHLEGKARFIFYSTNGNGYFWEFWKWPQFIRVERLMKGIK